MNTCRSVIKCLVIVFCVVGAQRRGMALDRMFLQSETASGSMFATFELDGAISYQTVVPAEVDVLDELVLHPNFGELTSAMLFHVYIPAGEFAFSSRITHGFDTQFFDVTVNYGDFDLYFRQNERGRLAQVNGEIRVDGATTLQRGTIPDLTWLIRDAETGESVTTTRSMVTSIGGVGSQSHTLVDVNLPNSAVLKVGSFGGVGGEFFFNEALGDQRFTRARFRITAPHDFENAPMIAYVPEPSSAIIAILGLASTAVLVRKTRRRADS